MSLPKILIFSITLSFLMGVIPFSFADSLPPLTKISSMYVPYADEYYSQVFTIPGSQTVSFPNPSFPVKKLVATVTTYVSGAEVLFEIQGINYSYSISPNSGTVLIFDEPKQLTNVRVTIDGRSFSDDAANVGYSDNIESIPIEEYPPTFHQGKALCVASANSCNDLIKSVLFDNGLSVYSVEILPTNLYDYDLVVLTDIGAEILSQSEKLKDYVQNGGNLAFVSGSAYWLQQTDHDWLGFSSAGYTSFGETARITNSPFDSWLNPGDVLKIQSNTEKGAQFVSGVNGNIIAEYGNGQPYSYYTEFGLGKIFYQADINESISGNEGLTNLKELFNSGINWLLENNLSIDAEPPEDEDKKFIVTSGNSKRTSPENEDEIRISNPLQRTEEPFIEIPLVYPIQNTDLLWIVPLAVPPILIKNRIHFPRLRIRKNQF